jgi:transposase
VQDLPILGKTVYLNIIAHEFKCENESCDTKTFVEDFDGFLSFYSRMTERCADFICTLALETSCEGSARICNSMNLKTSGDSVIRLLTKRFSKQEPLTCGDTIGVDDFSFKKRHKYGTIIVDGKTHKTVAVLDGRNGDSLKEWLQKNKHVKTVTRDRASAYAKAISEVLPDAIQIADRFHLHQNLLEAIKKVLGREIPATIAIPKEPETLSNIDEKSEATNSSMEKPIQGKKNAIICG